MIIYKATNKINGKVYIGQTRNSLEYRKRRHFSCARNGANTRFYSAIRKYGEDAFEWSVICEAKTKKELNFLETYYIGLYDSINTGYNIIDGGDNNIMDIVSVRTKHRLKMQSSEVRKKLSDTMKQKIANGEFFTEDHRKKLSERSMGNTKGLGNSSHSIAVYCLDKTYGRLDFKNYKEAGIWWYNTYHPFGEIYSQATYQRKIIECIKTGRCRFKKPGYREIIIDENEIKWFRK